MLFNGYCFTNEEDAAVAIASINEALGVADRNGVITNYTEYFEHNEHYYIEADERVISVLGAADEFELVFENIEEDGTN